MSEVCLKENIITVSPIQEPYKVGEFYLVQVVGLEGGHFGKVKFLTEQEVCLSHAFYATGSHGSITEKIYENTIVVSGFGNARMLAVFSLNAYPNDILFARSIVKSAYQLDLKNIREAASDKNNPYYFYNYANSSST